MRQFGMSLEDINPDDFEGRDPYDTVVIAGREITLYTPTTAQVALLAWSEGGMEDLRNVLNVLGYMMTQEEKRHVHRAILTGALGEDEIIDLAREVIESLSVHPSRQSSDSTASRRATGPSSTATSRRAASGRGTSRRASSSTSSTTD